MSRSLNHPPAGERRGVLRRSLPVVIPALLLAGGVVLLAVLPSSDKKPDPSAKKEERKDEQIKADAVPEGDDKDAIEALRKFGARIEQDEKAKGKPVVSVTIRGGFVMDKDVAPLKGL